ncbi:proclotting enzyme-like [Uloborus diversus]|uniref:proclotting enzyme-like n=1 Tax=Uloborus diversus TaxID=327109 RepID=UPI002408F393|nr:proclotting enzyme-like [Uloborus diversus]
MRYWHAILTFACSMFCIHSIPVSQENCGRSSVTFTRIVGGQEATLGAWPWMAIMFVVRRGRRSPECGGALVTDSHVITAAHCVVTSRRGNTINPRSLLVRLGEHDIENDNDGAKHLDVTVRFIIRHEHFNLRTFQNDIAILVLSSSIKFTQNISPICLPFQQFTDDTLAQRNAMTAGWGTISFGGPSSSKLMEVQLRIWQNPACRRIFRNDVPITNANLCAGDGDKDACSGDSGGPLMLTDEANRFYLIGIVSFGKKCGEPGIPGVYVRVSTFLDWIEQKLE